MYLQSCISQPMITQIHSQTKQSVAIRIIQRRSDAKILYGCFRLGIDEHITFNTTQPPEVLTLQIRSCTPAINFQSQFILTRFEEIIDKVFGRILGIFIIPHFLSVQINIATRFCSCDMQDKIPTLPVIGNNDFFSINSNRCFFGQERWLWIIRHKLIALIGINCCTKSLHLPITRYLNIMPVGKISLFRYRIDRQLFFSIGIPEFPSTIQ
ncbi:hypothetical protein EVA_02845 [gut metagenome]|uniref:Uncharacterized protein n=1 Tax=gut metagenome TaxID=749906 RepID=J9H597_9ZZZZ